MQPVLEPPKTSNAASFVLSNVLITKGPLKKKRKQKKKKRKPEEDSILGKTSASTVKVGRAGQSGCRDESHPACCFLPGYLGRMLARRKL